MPSGPNAATAPAPPGSSSGSSTAGSTTGADQAADPGASNRPSSSAGNGQPASQPQQPQQQQQQQQQQPTPPPPPALRPGQALTPETEARERPRVETLLALNAALLRAAQELQEAGRGCDLADLRGSEQRLPDTAREFHEYVPSLTHPPFLSFMFIFWRIGELTERG
jgi:hypothetical protein